MRLLPYGDSAILVELADAAERRRLDATLHRAALPQVIEQVPGARTVLVRAASAADVPALAGILRALDWQSTAVEPGPDARELVVPARYDGPDLPEVAALLGVDPAVVVARHTGQVWTVEFMGFAPGFGYLIGGGGLEVPRRASPRTRIPSGAVGLAGPYTGVYPRSSPGGWQLIGTTDLTMWDEQRQPPALFEPGMRVRFEALR